MSLYRCEECNSPAKQFTTPEGMFGVCKSAERQNVRGLSRWQRNTEEMKVNQSNSALFLLTAHLVHGLLHGG
jgi:hypothetical protein